MNIAIQYPKALVLSSSPGEPLLCKVSTALCPIAPVIAHGLSSSSWVGSGVFKGILEAVLLSAHQNWG